MSKTYRGFSSRTTYNEARGSRHSRWKRKKVGHLSEAQGHRCAYCSCDTFLIVENSEGVDTSPSKGMRKNQRATLEHFIPQSRNVQTNKDENLIMACAGCNSIRSNEDAFDFYRTIHDKNFREREGNKIMAPNKKQRKSAKSVRRRNAKAERRGKDAAGDGVKKQKLMEKEDRTWALAWALVTFWPPEIVEELIIRFTTPWELRKSGRVAKIEKIVMRMAA